MTWIAVTAVRSWRADECGAVTRRPRGDRVSDAPRAPVPSLLLRPADSGGRAPLLVAHVSGVRADLGARHSPAAVRKPAAAEAVGDVLGDCAGGRPLPVRSAFCSHRPVKDALDERLPCRPRLGGGVQSAAGEWWSELHRAAKIRADRATGHQGEDRGACVGEAETGLAHLHGVLSVESPAKCMGAGVHHRASRAGAALRVRLRRRLAQGRPEVLARRPSGRVSVELFAGGRGRKVAITENVLAGDCHGSWSSSGATSRRRLAARCEACEMRGGSGLPAKD